MADPLIVERDGRVVTLINNDPPYNPINLDFMDALEEQVDALELDASVGAVVLRSAGDEHFSVGMNLKETDEGIARKGSTEGVLDQALRIITKIETMDKPWIATLYGYCLGGGLEFPLGCHFRLAAEEGARIGLPEFHIGSLPALGGTARLTRCVGRANALDMILRVKMISGPEAYRIGLVQYVYPNDELQQRAKDLAKELAMRPPKAMASVLRCVVGAEETTVSEVIQIERREVRRGLGNEEIQEGMRAFAEKRAPNYFPDGS